MGLFPLVLDMPVRFTDSVNREQGVFKHSRGWVRGWTFSAEEQARLEEIQDPEVVLLEPRDLYRGGDGNCCDAKKTWKSNLRLALGLQTLVP